MRLTAILILLISLPAYGQQSDEKAPLPDQIVKAKTVYLMNETGKAKFAARTSCSCTRRGTTQPAGTVNGPGVTGC